eukprot:3245078-Alexandrium_andersonii.AAC.1
MDSGKARPYRSATARRHALRAAVLRRMQAGVRRARSPAEELTDAVAAHHAAMWRLATRAIEAFGAPTTSALRGNEPTV